MTKANVVDIKGKKIKEMELPASLFEAPINIDLMHQAYIRQATNARLGTVETKVRSDVSGGGRKPWRQKGTGRARQGSTRSAQWVGGGKIHTPHMHAYNLKMPRKMRRAAICSALSVKASENAVILVDNFEMEEVKTKALLQTVGQITGGQSTLLVLADKSSNEKVFRSAENLDSIKVLPANYLNIRDLFTYDQVVFDLRAIEVMESFLGKGKSAK
jgi:large subunit ribosomal protein L4